MSLKNCRVLHWSGGRFAIASHKTVEGYWARQNLRNKATKLFTINTVGTFPLHLKSFRWTPQEGTGQTTKADESGSKDQYAAGEQERRIRRLQEIKDELMSPVDWKRL